MEERLHRGEYGSDVIGGRPPVLENVKAQLSVRIHIWMKHLRQKLHCWGYFDERER